MIQFGPWLPDMAELNSAIATEAFNVVPSASGYRPFKDLVATTDALTARAQGAFTARSQAGTVFNFAGDATKLYLLDSTGLSWDDISRSSGGAYATPSDGWWSFAVFGNIVLACNGVDATQSFTMGTSTNFAAASGSPPIATFAGTVRDFAVLARIASAETKLQWSAINNAASWAASATTLADSQTFPDGGSIMGFVGGEYGVVFQERAISRMSFEGPPTAFRFDKLSNTLGCRIEGSIAAYDNFIFFCGNDGFYEIRGGSQIVPIGEGKINRWFESVYDPTKSYMVSSAIDPVNKVYICGFPDSGDSATVASNFLIYHWPTAQWSRATKSHQLIYMAAPQTTYTIDGLDTLSATIDGLPYPVDSRFYNSTGQISVAGFSTGRAQGYFNGLALGGIIDTGEVQLVPGRKAMVRGFRPIVQGDGTARRAKIKYRDHQTDQVLSTTAVTANTYGFCPFRVNARYHRAQLAIPAGSTWDYALGIEDLKFSQMGTR